MFINSPLDQFEIRNYVSIDSPFINITPLGFTNFALYTVIILGLILIIHTLSVGNNGIIPTRWSLGVESLYSTLQSMVMNQIGINAQALFPFIYTLFVTILISNLISMVPYNFAIMSHLIFTVSLSATIWVGVTILGFYKQSIKFFGLFVPSGCSLPLVPVLVIIELLSYIARSASLGLRLGANILAGHLLMVILGGLIYDFMSSSVLFFIIGFLPLGLVLGIMSLEFAIGAIQAYVFSILTCSYIKDALYAH